MKGKMKLIAAAAVIAVAVPAAVFFSQHSESVSTDSDNNIQNVISNEQVNSAPSENRNPGVTDESTAKSQSDQNVLMQGEYHGPAVNQAEGLPHMQPESRGDDPYLTIPTTKEIQ